jgi:hypothetical protein
MTFFHTIVHPETKVEYDISSDEGMQILHNYMSVMDGSYVFNNELIQSGGGELSPGEAADCNLEQMNIQEYRTPCVNISSKKGGKLRQQKTRRSKKNMEHN